LANMLPRRVVLSDSDSLGIVGAVPLTTPDSVLFATVAILPAIPGCIMLANMLPRRVVLSDSDSLGIVNAVLLTIPGSVLLVTVAVPPAIPG